MLSNLLITVLGSRAQLPHCCPYEVSSFVHPTVSQLELLPSSWSQNPVSSGSRVWILNMESIIAKSLSMTGKRGWGDGGRDSFKVGET